MKKYISISLMAAALVGISSCDMDTTNPSAMDGAQVYTTPALAEQAVLASLEPLTGDGALRRITRYGGANSDSEWENGADATKADAKYDATDYSTSPSNTELNKTSSGASSAYYAQLYKSIERATVAINNLAANMGSNTQLQYSYGEALTLRAFYYMELIKYYGDVPMRFEETTSTNAYLPRSSRDDILIRLLEDLKTAEAYVPWPNGSSATQSTERVSKSFTKGLRARAALYACGYALRDNNGTADYSKSTREELSEDKMMQIVKDECLDIINNHPSKLANLAFIDNFKNLCADVTTAGKESIWEFPYNDSRGQLLYAYAPRHETTSTTADPNIAVSGAKYGCQVCVLPSFYYTWDKRDARRDITCMFYGYADMKPTITKITNIYFGKLRYDWMKRAITSQDDGVNVQFMRLADIYLMAAEAINALDGDPNAAWQYMEPVVARSCSSDLVNELKTKYTASKEAFQNGIVEQRGYEFAGEMMRKFDLIRWGIIDEKMEEAKATMKRLQNRTDEFADLPEKIYYLVNGSTMELYGLEHGDTDDEGKTKAGWTNTGWIVSSGNPRITTANIDGIFTVDKPSLHCNWPIPQAVISADITGSLNNNYLGY